MDTSAYLNKISGDFAQAKAKAQAMLNPPASLPKPANELHVTSFPSIDFDADNLAQLHDVPFLDPIRSTARTYADTPLPVLNAVVEGSEIKTVLPARPLEGEICIIDWLHVVLAITTFDDAQTRAITHLDLYHNRIVKNISDTLVSILGFGVSEQLPGGKNFYEKSWRLEHNTGFICLGGQADTVLIILNGTGCDYAKSNWSLRMWAFLTFQAIAPKITRVDLAHDDLNPTVADLQWFTRQFDKGGFCAGGRKPNVEMRGNWKNPNGKGRTLYIGTRESPKFCRIYEKGKQLGDKDSPWLRVEVEYKAKGQFIPIDVLRKPSNFFIQSYPCFHVFNGENITEAKFERIEREAQISFAKSVEITRHQFGRYINAFRLEFAKHGLNDSDLLDLLTDLQNKAYPERIDKLTIPQYFKDLDNGN